MNAYAPVLSSSITSRQLSVGVSCTPQPMQQHSMPPQTLPEPLLPEGITWITTTEAAGRMRSIAEVAWHVVPPERALALLVDRHPHDGVQLRDPHRLLQAWRERCRFDRHQIRKRSIASRSGVDLAGTVNAAHQDSRQAFKGLAAAWWWDASAPFRWPSYTTCMRTST